MFRTFKIATLFVLLSSCYFGGGGGYNSNNLSLFHSLPSVGDVGYSDSEYFYIDLDVERYRNEIVPYYEISTTDNFGDSVDRDSPSNCEIILSEDSDDLVKTPSENTLICILDFLEYDLLIKDLHIKYNFPHGMCEYVEVSLPWHFNYPITGAMETKACRKRDPEKNESKYCSNLTTFNCTGEAVNATKDLTCGNSFCGDWSSDCKEEKEEIEIKYCDFGSNGCLDSRPSELGDTLISCNNGAKFCDWTNHCKENQDRGSDPVYTNRCSKLPEFTEPCTKRAYNDGECLASISGPCPDSDCQVFGDKKEDQTEFRCPSDKRGKAGRSKYPRCCVGGLILIKKMLLLFLMMSVMVALH